MSQVMYTSILAGLLGFTITSIPAFILSINAICKGYDDTFFRIVATIWPVCVTLIALLLLLRN